jgi:hypothetical protein
MQLEVLRQVATVALAGSPPTLELGSSTVTVEISAPHLEVALELAAPQLTFNAGPAIELTVPQVTVEIALAGAQGPPGPPQIFDQASAPPAVPGYTLLWFQSGVSADPDDRELNLVVSP